MNASAVWKARVRRPSLMSRLVHYWYYPDDEYYSEDEARERTEWWAEKGYDVEIYLAKTVPKGRVTVRKPK